MQSWKSYHAKSLQLGPNLCNLMDLSCQAPLSMGFFRQEYWSGLPCPPPGALPNPGIKPTSLTSPASAGRFFTTSATWEAPRITSTLSKSRIWGLINEILCHQSMVYLHLICDRESLEDLGAILILALEKLPNLEMFIFFQSMLRKENQLFFPLCASAANISLKLQVHGE